MPKIYRDASIKLFDVQALNTSFQSSSINLDSSITFAAQVSWTAGTNLLGQLFFEGSNDNTVWTKIAVLNLSDVTGSAIVSEGTVGFSFLRARYVFGTGNGTLKIVINLKSFSE